MYMGYNSNLIEFMGGRYNVRTSITKRSNSSNHIFTCSFDLVAHNSEKKGKLSFLVRNKETYRKKQKEMDSYFDFHCYRILVIWRVCDFSEGTNGSSRLAI